LLQVLFRGINRALPYTDLPKQEHAKNFDNLLATASKPSFPKKIQALSLVLRNLPTLVTENFPDRFYHILWASLLSPTLVSSFDIEAKTQLLQLLYSILKKDSNLERNKAFFKRLFTIACFSQPPFTCAALQLYSKIFNVKTALRSMTFYGEETDKQKQFQPGASDPMKAHAQGVCLWELTLLQFHPHPMISKAVASLFSLQTFAYPDNPLESLLLPSFVDSLVNQETPNSKPSHPSYPDFVGMPDFLQLEKQDFPEKIFSEIPKKKKKTKDRTREKKDRKKEAKEKEKKETLAKLQKKKEKNKEKKKAKKRKLLGIEEEQKEKAIEVHLEKIHQMLDAEFQKDLADSEDEMEDDKELLS